MLRKLSLGLLLMTGLAAGLLSKPVTAAPSMMGITVSISPTGAAVVVGLDRQFTSTVNGTMNTSAVTWAINGVAGGNSTLGTVDSTGHYKAPAVPPPGYIVTLSATSVEDPTVSASTTIYVIWYKPVMAAVNPWSIPLGAFTLSITGSNFVSGDTLTFTDPVGNLFANKTPTFSSSGELDYSLNDANASRQHAELVKREDGWWLVDLDSTNGTFVNGSMVKERRLGPGDRIQIGSSKLEFVTEQVPPAPQKAPPAAVPEPTQVVSDPLNAD